MVFIKILRNGRNWPKRLILLAHFRSFLFIPSYTLWEILKRSSLPVRGVFEKSFKILNFGLNGMHSKFTVLVHFGAQFIPQKPKKLPKTKIYAKTASLGIPNNLSPRSQKNYKILVAWNKKFFFFFFGRGGTNWV